jgi:branched-subunit amino acid ABC-type transport system permease component
MGTSASVYAVQLLIGIAAGSLLFLIASGLTLTFGAMRIVNFAHGSLYMVGAYLTLWLTPAAGLTNGNFWLVFLAAAAIVAAIGLVLEVVIFRRIYKRPLLVQFLATFSLIFIIGGILREGFGAATRTTSRPPAFKGSIEILGAHVPTFNFVFIAAALLVAIALWGILHQTRLGTLIRACVSDPVLLQLAGVNVSRVFTVVLVISSFFAGLAGAIVTLSGAVTPAMAFNAIVQAFVVVIIGGLGSIRGAFLGAMLVGVAESLGLLWIPQASVAMVFAVLVAVLAIRPQGLFGS